jgi:hypothetical protein
MGKDVNARAKSEAEVKAIKNMYTDLDYASLSAKDKAFVDRHKKEALGFASSSVPSYKKGGKVFKPHNMYKDGKVVKAKTMADHLRLKKKGYTHKKG